MTMSFWPSSSGPGCTKDMTFDDEQVHDQHVMLGFRKFLTLKNNLCLCHIGTRCVPRSFRSGFTKHIKFDDEQIYDHYDKLNLQCTLSPTRSPHTADHLLKTHI